VDFVQGEIVEYFLAHAGEFDFIHFNSLHHIADYIGALAPAVMALTPGGFLYIAEGERCGWLRLFFTKLDDHLFALSDDKKKWLGRVTSRLGINFDKRVEKAWRLTREAEVHATNGLDFTAILEELGRNGCEVIVDHRGTYPQSRLASFLRFPIRKTRHLLIRKNTPPK
jgi:SAM-dependent methyltransferase